MIGAIERSVIRWLDVVLNVVLCLYCRFNSKAYLKGYGGTGTFLSDIEGSLRWGFSSIAARGYDMGSHFVVLLRSGEGVRQFLDMGDKMLARCAVVYAWGDEAKSALAVNGRMKEAMSVQLPLGVWSPTVVPAATLKPVHLYVFWVALWVLLFYMGFFFPYDDLLRHAVSYKWGYNYNIPYFDSVYQTHFDMYIGFDIIVGLLHRFLGKSSLLIVQLFSLTLTFAALARMLRGSEDNMKVLVLLFMVVIVRSRFVLGRPSLACSSIMLWLIAYRDELPVAIKVGIGVLMGPLYHLFWVYFAPLVIFDRRHLVGLVSGLGFWVAYSHGLYFSEFMNVIVREMGMRNVRITENVSIMGFMFSHWVFYIPFVMKMSKDWKSAASIVALSLTNQVRYIESIMPFVLGYFRFVRLRVSTVVVLGLVFFSITMVRYRLDVFEEEAMGKLIPAGSRVLTDDMATAYHLVFWEPTLKVSPHYAYGLTPKDTQALYAGFSNGELDCRNEAIMRFNYVVERSLKGIAPGCLSPVGLAGELRVWKVRAGS